MLRLPSPPTDVFCLFQMYAASPFFMISRIKILVGKGGSHKDVTILLVGTGILDCPLKHNCDAEDKESPPTDYYLRSVGGIILFDKL